jgi:uncharacterized protein YpuA (DUF1002 family)
MKKLKGREIVKMKKQFAILGIVLFSTALLAFGAGKASAEVVKNEDGSFSITDERGFTYGWSLTGQQFQDTVAKLQVKNDDNVAPVSKNNAENKGLYTFPISGADLVKYLPDAGFSDSSGAWSSAYIVPNSKDGVRVKVIGNITYYTAAQYQSAAITAGLTNVDIYVYSAKPVDGSGALTGINAYIDKRLKPEDAQDASDRAESRAVAQQELETLGDITATNKDKTGYSDDKMVAALSDMKAQVVRETDAGKKQATPEEISDIVTDGLKKNDLQDLVTPTQQQNLVKLLEDFQASPAVKNEQLLKQLDDLKENVMGKASETLAAMKDNLNSEQAQGILQKISSGFNAFIDKIMSLFRKG